MSNESQNKLLETYNAMRDTVREAWNQVEEKTLPNLKEALEKAEEKASELGELGREEIDKLSEYLKKDLEAAIDTMTENGRELADWLEFDLEFAESRFADWVAQVADPTRVEMARFMEQTRELSEWHTGEITGPGTLICKACGEKLHFDKAGHIPPCPKCHATAFEKEYLNLGE